MFRDWKIGKRLTLAFGLTLVLVGIVATTGFWGLTRMATTVTTILNGDARLMASAASAQAHTLDLRRFEKDTFLNVGDAAAVTDYTNKWDKSYRDLLDDLDRLDKLAVTAEDKETVRSMRTDLNAYINGFQFVARDVKDGKIATPAAANAAITPYKDEIRRLDSTAADFAKTNAVRMSAKEKVVQDVEKNTRLTMALVCIAGIIIVFFMTIAVTRSITAPILEVVSYAEKLAAGETELDIPTRGSDETGTLFAAMKKMVASNGEMVSAATGIAAGDLRVRVTPRSDRDALGKALGNMKIGRAHV